MAASDSENVQLESNLKAMGHRLSHSRVLSAKDLLLLDQVDNCLKKVNQCPSESMQKVLSVVKNALVLDHIFRHSNEDVRVEVASSLAELIRITAPNAPYDDNQMKEVPKLIVTSLKDLSNKPSRSYHKLASILEIVAECRVCCLMLDLDCDALIIEMFRHFFKAIRDYHPQAVFSYMEMIMTRVFEESDIISIELLLPILHIVKRDNQEVLPIARKLAEKVLGCSVSVLKPYLIQAVKKSGFSLCHYSKIVAFICQETSGDGEQNDAVTNDLQADEAILKEAGSAKQVDLPNDKSPKLVVSDDVVQLSKDDSLADLNSLKKKDHCHHAGRPKNVDKSHIAEPEILGTEMFYKGVDSLDAVIKRNKGEPAGHPSTDAEMMSTSQNKISSAEPSNVPTSAINSDLEILHIHLGQPNKRKSVAVTASSFEKRVFYNARERTQNSLDEMSSEVKFETTHKESLNDLTLYRKCLEELQDLEELDDAEFAKAVIVLKDDKNAIAFTTIKGPRRLVWLRSLLQSF